LSTFPERRAVTIHPSSRPYSGIFLQLLTDYPIFDANIIFAFQKFLPNCINLLLLYEIINPTLWNVKIISVDNNVFLILYKLPAIFCFKSEHWYNCTTVQLYNCTTVQLYNCTTVQLYNFTTVRLYNCTTVQLYNCTTVQLYNCTTVQLYNCTTVQLYNCTTVQLYYCTTLLVYNCTTVQLYNCTTVQLYNCTTVLLYNCTTVQLYNSTGPWHRPWKIWKILSFSWLEKCWILNISPLIYDKEMRAEIKINSETKTWISSLYLIKLSWYGIVVNRSLQSFRWESLKVSWLSYISHNCRSNNGNLQNSHFFRQNNFKI